MPSSKDYKANAHNCLDIAEQQTTDPATANLLRMLAADYFALAEGAASQQQQQIQPEEPKTDKT
jgi:hypothetical protein